MEFSFVKKEHIGVFRLKGNLIGETDGIPISEAFSEYLGAGVKQFVIDLSELQHINSTGLGVLITLLTRARKVGGEVNLANPSEYIKNLLLITKLNTIFKIYDTTEDAVAEYTA